MDAATNQLPDTTGKSWLTARTALLAIFVTSMGLLSASALAAGDSRATYTVDRPAQHITFNSVTNNPTHGDERNFVLVREAGRGSFVDTIAVQPGRTYEVYMYFHNNATTGVATNVRALAQLPATISASETGVILGKISADNATPVMIWDDAMLTTTQPVAVRYVPSSAVLHSSGAVNGTQIPDTLFASHGSLVGFQALDGMVPAGASHAGYIIYRLAVEAVASPVPAAVDTDALELPKTGVEQAVGTVIGLVLLVLGVGYYFKSRHELQQSLASGKHDAPLTNATPLEPEVDGAVGISKRAE